MNGDLAKMGTTTMGRVSRNVRTVLVSAFTLGVTANAEAAPRVAVLGPSDSPVTLRLQRNVASMKLEASPASVSLCSRDVVERLSGELGAEQALCTDGDQIAVWAKDHGRLVLKDAIVVGDQGSRGQELAAARAVMALQAPSDGSAGPQGSVRAITFTVNGNASTNGGAPTLEEAPPVKDTPAPPPRPAAPLPRNAPAFVLAVGPAVTASRDGGSFALEAKAALGVGRYVALVPWLQYVPANRSVERPAGTASFRPTIFGLGFDVPVSPVTSTVVPRLGAGYGLLWMHVAPDSAVAPATEHSPEDLLAPLMYGTLALSVKMTSSTRIAAEGMLGTTSHDMIVRIAGNDAAHWGAPIASLGVHAEWVLP